MAEKQALSRRSLARRVASQALYQWLVNETPPDQLLSQFREEGLGRADAAYFQELMSGCIREAVPLTQAFSKHLDRELDQIDPVERAILMVGCYELMFEPSVPWRVAVNEAVNLAKTFGAADSYKYINGVLDRIAHELRADDIAAGL